MTRMFLLAAPLVFAASAALAEEFTIFIYETPAEIALRADRGPDGAAYWSAFAEYGAALGEAGVMRGGAPLLVSATDAGTAGDLILGGYFRIETPTLAEAQALAAQAPSTVRGGAATAVGHMPTQATMLTQ